MPCNLEPIIQWLKENELDLLKEVLKNVTKQFNGEMLKKPGQMMETDDKQSTSVGSYIEIKPVASLPFCFFIVSLFDILMLYFE